jgi:hypothetical protein
MFDINGDSTMDGREVGTKSLTSGRMASPTLVEESEESELRDVSIVEAIDGLEDDVCLTNVDFLLGLALLGWR